MSILSYILSKVCLYVSAEVTTCVEVHLHHPTKIFVKIEKIYSPNKPSKKV